MAAAAGYSVSISAVDKISGTLDKINKRFSAVTAPVTRLTTATSKLGDVSGINAMGRGVISLGTGMTNLAQRAAAAVTPLQAIVGAASIAGVVRLTEAFGDFGSRLGNDARNIGSTVSGLSSMQGAARLAGSSAESLTSGMTGLADSITDSIGGRNMQALGYFRQLNIGLHNANGSAKTAQQVFPEVANAIARIGDPRLQARVARAFGFSEDMLPALRLGADGFARLQEQARRNGAMNEAGAAAALKMRQAQEGLTQSVEGLGNAIGERLTPVLAPMLTGLADWINAHRTDIADTIGNIATQFKEWATGGSLTTLWTDIKTFGGELKAAWVGIDKFVTDTIGWKAALIGLAGAWTANQFGLTGFTTAMTALTLLKLPAWLAGVIGGSTAAALAGGAATLALHGDTDPNATADGFRTGWLPDNGPGSKGHDVAHGASNIGLRSEAAMDNMAARPSWWERNAPTWAGGGPAISSAAARANLKESFDFWRSKGATVPGAAAMVAQEDSESSGNPGTTGDGGQAKGSFQWHPDRRAAIQRSTGIDVTDPRATHRQHLDAAYAEMSRSLDAGAGRAYRAIFSPTATIDDAVRSGVDDFERPADRQGRFRTDRRKAANYAQEFGPPPSPETNGFRSLYRPDRETPAIAVPHTPPAAPSPQAAGPYSPSPDAAAPAAPPGAAGPNGTVKVDITHSNAPAGTTSRVATTGDVTATSRIETAMPMLAFP